MNSTKKTTRKKVTAVGSASALVAGVDIGSREHWVAGPPGPNGEATVRQFGTTTPDLIELVDWLAALGVTSVAMESTSVYWIPLYELLESRGVQPVLVNARHLHNVPGRAKTDYRDCQWLQVLHARGLLRGSFRPTETITRLRALHRQMQNFVEERTRSVQWMQKALDQMNVQVHHAVTDITGATGMSVVRAIVAGERDPLVLAQHRDPRCRKTVDEIARCLTGTWREEQLFNLEAAVALYDKVEELILIYQQRLLREIEGLQPPERRDLEVPRHPNKAKEKNLRARGAQPMREALWRFAGVDLTRIDGIAADAVHVIITEVGLNLSAFPSENHFVSWLRLCPRTSISGGKPLRKKKRHSLGASRVANVLRMAAASLHHSKTALGAAYRRIARRKGSGVATFAIARHLALLVYRALRFGQDYLDIGEKVYEARFAARRLVTLKENARALGYVLQEDPSVAT